MLGKTFKRMTDDLLRWETEPLQGVEDRRTDWTVHVRPELVVEIGFNEMHVSPRYPGGVDFASRGSSPTVSTNRRVRPIPSTPFAPSTRANGGSRSPRPDAPPELPCAFSRP